MSLQPPVSLQNSKETHYFCYWENNTHNLINFESNERKVSGWNVPNKFIRVHIKSMRINWSMWVDECTTHPSFVRIIHSKPKHSVQLASTNETIWKSAFRSLAFLFARNNSQLNGITFAKKTVCVRRDAMPFDEKVGTQSDKVWTIEQKLNINMPQHDHSLAQTILMSNNFLMHFSFYLKVNGVPLFL